MWSGDDKTYVIAGDAKVSVDSEPVERDEITDHGILLIPYMGLLVAWLWL